MGVLCVCYIVQLYWWECLEVWTVLSGAAVVCVLNGGEPWEFCVCTT